MTNVIVVIFVKVIKERRKRLVPKLSIYSSISKYAQSVFNKLHVLKKNYLLVVWTSSFLSTRDSGQMVCINPGHIPSQWHYRNSYHLRGHLWQQTPCSQLRNQGGQQNRCYWKKTKNIHDSIKKSWWLHRLSSAAKQVRNPVHV